MIMHEPKAWHNDSSFGEARSIQLMLHTPFSWWYKIEMYNPATATQGLDYVRKGFTAVIMYAFTYTLLCPFPPAMHFPVLRCIFNVVFAALACNQSSRFQSAS